VDRRERRQVVFRTLSADYTRGFAAACWPIDVFPEPDRVSDPPFNTRPDAEPEAVADAGIRPELHAGAGGAHGTPKISPDRPFVHAPMPVSAARPPLASAIPGGASHSHE
jgi:hypothetical protein